MKELNRIAEGAMPQPPRKEAAMISFSDLIQFVIMLCAVITLVVVIVTKK